jgi:G:T-mismatch repair DNA endonuclease (very short patch repair protein)
MDDEFIDKKSFIIWNRKVKSFLMYRMQIKYDINAPDFMIREYAICVFFKHGFWN